MITTGESITKFKGKWKPVLSASSYTDHYVFWFVYSKGTTFFIQKIAFEIWEIAFVNIKLHALNSTIFYNIRSLYDAVRVFYRNPWMSYVTWSHRNGYDNNLLHLHCALHGWWCLCGLISVFRNVLSRTKYL